MKKLFVVTLLLGLGIFVGPIMYGEAGWDPFDAVSDDIPLGCPEDAVLVGVGEYSDGRFERYECGPSLDDFCPVDPFTVTPEVTDTPEPTDTPVVPTPTVTPTDAPEQDQACNRGVGNYEEGCDPGNSYGQGRGGGRPAGEDRAEDQGPVGKGQGNDK